METVARSGLDPVALARRASLRRRRGHAASARPRRTSRTAEPVRAAPGSSRDGAVRLRRRHRRRPGRRRGLRRGEPASRAARSGGRAGRHRSAARARVPLHLEPLRVAAAARHFAGAVSARRPHPRQGRLARRSGRARRFARPSACGSRSSSGIDWFDLHGAVDFGDGRSAPFPQLLAAVARGEDVVVLDDGSVGLLPEDWLRRYAAIAGFGSADGDAIRFGRSQAALLDALLAAQPAIAYDETFARAAIGAAHVQRHSRRWIRRRRFTGRCASTSARRSAGSSSCGGSGSAAAWPTTWASARPSWCSRCSTRGGRCDGSEGARAVDRRRAAVAGVQLARRGGAVRAEAEGRRLHRHAARSGRDRAAPISC